MCIKPTELLLLCYMLHNSIIIVFNQMIRRRDLDRCGTRFSPVRVRHLHLTKPGPLNHEQKGPGNGESLATFLTLLNLAVGCYGLVDSILELLIQK